MTKYQLFGKLHMQALRYSCRCLLTLWALLGVTHPICGQNVSACGEPDWFAAQQSYRVGKTTSPLCAAELEAASDHRKLAERELHRIIRQAPQGAEAYEAHSVLSHFYLRIGRFRDAEAQIRAMLAAKPDAPDLVNVRSLFKILASNPDLGVTPGRPATVGSQIIDGNIFMQVLVNGAAKSYMVDTGLDLSMMSEREASHLGLTSQTSTTKLSDISGLSGLELRVVEVEDLVIGNTRLRHVPFLVVADTNGAFAGVPADQHAILGIQPLIAAGTLRFQADGTLRIGGKPERAKNTAPLLFDGTSPLTQITFQGRPLTVTFDTGATQTTLNPPFTTRYPGLIQNSATESHTMNGLSGTTAQRSVSLPQLRFTFGREVVLSPATILLNETTGASAWATANLGFDLMQQAEPFTIDFHKMRIEFSASQ